MKDFHIPTMREGYAEIARYVAENGERVAPRGVATYEVQGATIVLEDPFESLPIGVNRKLNLGIAAAEALQLIGGFSDPALMRSVSTNFDQFRDGGIFHGAYGPRVRAQLPRVVERLRRDPASRQAIIVLWDPLHDLMNDGMHDYPCTISLQFFVRGGRLDMHTHMRSNDVWWGLAYDAFQFCQLQYTVARALGRDVGQYFHHANSLHVYEHDLAAIDQLTAPDMDRSHPIAMGVVAPSIELAMIYARDIGSGQLPQPFSPNVWYADTLAPFIRARAA